MTFTRINRGIALNNLRILQPTVLFVGFI